MIGEVKKIVGSKMFGFIRSGNIEYFFHRDNFEGNFKELEEDYLAGKILTVEFEPENNVRGPRAANVRILEEPRTAKGSLD